MRKIITEHDGSRARRPYLSAPPPGRPRNLVGARPARSSCASQWQAESHALRGCSDRARFAARAALVMPRPAVTLCLPVTAG